MSTTIDQKVVEMRFDNKHFENNVSTTMSTLDKLKQKLNFTGSGKSLEDLGHAARKVDMNPLAQGVEHVRMKFSALQVMGVTALQNITNQAVNAAKGFVNSLTIAPIKDGFSEYEMTLNAIQTTMAGTGKTAAEVEKELKKLDEYADKTVYSTADMLNNLPKFTNAGVELEDATKAMIGIANATALAGGDAGKASIAFYNLGQAIGTGYLTRMDYNSINNAGIATMEWKEQMVEAAIAAGTLKKAEDGLYEAGGKTFTMQQLFIDGLQHQWATTDVMMKVFGDYGNETTEIGKKAYSAAQDIKTFSMMMDSLKATAGTGWKDTWQTIFGGLDDAKVFWTSLTNTISGVITGFADWRNELLGKALGNPFEGLTKALSSVSKPVETVTENLEELDKMATRVIRGEFGNGAERVRKLTEAGWNYAKIQNIVNERLGSSVRLQEDVIGEQKETNEVRGDTIEKLLKLSDAELEAAGCTKEEIAALRELEKYAEKTGIPIEELTKDLDQLSGRNLLINSFKNIGKVLGEAGKAAKDAWQSIFPPKSVEDRAKGIYDAIAAFHKFTRSLTLVDAETGKLNETGDKLQRTLKGIFAAFDIVLTITAGPLKWAFQGVLNVLDLYGLSFLDLTAYIGDGIVKIRDWLKANNLWVKMIEFIVPRLMDAADGVKAWIESLKDAEDLPKAIAKGIMNGLGKALTFVGDLITRLFDSIVNGMNNVPDNIISGLVDGLWNGIKLVGQVMIELGKLIIQKICEVLGIHSPSKVFFEIGKNIIQGLYNGIKTSLGIVWDLMMSLGSKIIELIKGLDFGQVFVSTIGVGMVAGVWKLADTAKNISAALKMIVSPLEGLGDLLDSVGDAVRDIGKGFKRRQNAEALKSFAIAIGILVAAVVVLTFVDQDKILGAVQTILVLAGVIVALGFAASAISRIGALDPKSLLVLLGIAAALLIISKVFTTLAGIDVDNAIKVVVGFALMLGGLVLAVKFMAEFTKDSLFMGEIGAMLLKMSFAMLLMVGVVKLAAGIKVNEVQRAAGVIGLVGALFVAVVAVSKFSGEHAKSAGSMLLKMSFAMLLMVGVVKLAAGIDINEALRGMAVIAAIGLLFTALIAVSNLANEHARKAGSMILSMSIAIGMIAFVIKQIDKIDDRTLIRGLVVISIIGGMIAALVAVSSLAGQNAGKAGLMLLSIAGVMTVMVGLIFLMSLMDPKDMAPGIIAIAALSACIAGLIAVTKYHKVTKTLQKTLITLAVIIGILTALMIALTFMDPKKVAVGTGAIALIIGAFSTLLMSTKHISDTKPMLKTIWTMTAVVAALAGVLALMSLLDQRSVMTSSAALSILLLSFTSALAILGKSKTKVICKDALLSILMLVGVMYAMGALLAAMSLLTLIDGIDVNALPVIATALGIMLTALVGVTNFLGTAKLPQKGTLGRTAGTLFTLAGVMGALGLVLAMMTALKVKKAIPNAIALSVMLVALGGVAVLLGTIGKTGGKMAVAALTLGILAGVMAALGLVLAMMNALDVRNSVEHAIVLSGLLLVLAGVAAIMGLLGATAGSLALGSLCLFILVGVMATLGLVLAMMNALDVKNGAENAKILVGMLIALTGVAVVMSIFGFLSVGIASGALAMVLLVGVMATLGLVLKLMEALNLQNAEANATLLIGLITALSDICVKLAIVGPLAIVGVTALAALEGLMVAAAVLAVAIGALAVYWPDFQTFIDTGIPLMIKLAGGVGEMVGAFVGGVFEGIAGSLPGIADSLSDFMERLQPFIDKVKAVDGTVLAGAGYIAGAMLVLTAADLINGLVSIGPFSEGLPALGTQLSTFMTNAADFIEGASQIDSSVVTAAANLAGVVLALTAAGVLDGIASLLGMGDSSLEKFGTELPVLGTGIAAFAKSLREGGFTESDKTLIGFAAEAIRTLAEVAQELPNTGGLLGMLVGDNDMGPWATQLGALADGLVGFIAKIKTAGLSEADLTLVGYAATAMKDLAKVSQEIPNVGGLLAKLVGDNEMDTWAGKLGALADGLVGFIAKIKTAGLSEADLVIVGYAATAIKDLAKVAQEIPNTGGLLAKLVGDNNMEDFAAQLPKLAEGITGFVSKLNESGFTDASLGVIDSAVSAIRTFAQLAVELGDNWWEKLLGTGTTGAMQSLATNLPALGTAIAGFATNAAVLTEDQVKALKTAIEAVKLFLDLNSYSSNTGDASKLSLIAYNMKKFGEDMKKFSDNMTEDVVTACGTADKVISSLSTMISKLGTIDLKPVNSFGTSMKTLGNAISRDFVEAVGSNTAIGDAKEVGQSLINAVYSGIKTPPKGSSLKDVGNGVVSDLKTTLTSSANKTSLEGAGNTMVASFAEAFESTTHLEWGASKVVTNMVSLIKSTDNYSKMSGAGDYLVQGFAAGITANTFKAEAQATAMAEAAIAAAKEALRIKSPSRVFYEIGGYTVAGFVNALAESGGRVRSAGAGLAKAAKNGMNSAISAVVDMINTDMDSQPTIRPVLDLSDVETGMGAIDNMLGANRALGIAASVDSVNSVNSMMANRQNGSSGTDIVGAINKLRKDLANVNTTTNYINGISYTGDADLDGAFQTIIQAARLERRT